MLKAGRPQMRAILEPPKIDATLPSEFRQALMSFSYQERLQLARGLGRSLSCVNDWRSGRRKPSRDIMRRVVAWRMAGCPAAPVKNNDLNLKKPNLRKGG